jgi:hypothetical protein
MSEQPDKARRKLLAKRRKEERLRAKKALDDQLTKGNILHEARRCTCHSKP